MGTDRPRGGPTVLRILLGAQLRRLREAAGYSRAYAGDVIRGSESKMSRLERGVVRFKENDVRDLLTLYGVTDEEEQDQLVSLARQGNKPGWWQRYSDIFPSGFDPYVGLEEAATRIRTYEAHYVPGLLQTEEYARAVIAAGNPKASAEEVERRVSLRMTRQRLLSQPDAPKLWAIVDEAALRRFIGGSEVMRAQLEHLRAATKSPNVTLQVLPFSSGASAAEGVAFTVLRFSEPELPDVVYVEQLASVLYLEKRDELNKHIDVLERLADQAEDPADTADIIGRILTEI